MAKRTPLIICLVLAGAAAAVAPAQAAPAQVILIRHAEKPASGNELDPRGFQRAKALAGFFENTPSMTRYGTPAAIYAMAPKDQNGSLRPIETVTPLADSLGLKINSAYKKEELSSLIGDILNTSAYDGKMVLVCWEHNMIPEIVKGFGWSGAPLSWDGSVFDRAWVLNFTGGAVVSFEDIPQRLLPGDSEQ